MNLTTYQILALIGGVAGMATVFGIGFYEGRRTAAAGQTQAIQEQRDLLETARQRLERAEHEHSISRLNAAQALEVLTEQRDALLGEASGRKLQLITARERAEALEARALTAPDAGHLADMADKLGLAGACFEAMGATTPATRSRELASKARALSARYYATLPEQAPQQERAA